MPTSKNQNSGSKGDMKPQKASSPSGKTDANKSASVKNGSTAIKSTKSSDTKNSK